MKRNCFKILYLLVMLTASLMSVANDKCVSGLNAKDFKKYWVIESEGPCKVTFQGDTAEFVAPKGLSVWRKDKM
ncbi:MAG: hypothetical protein K2K23_07040, partial [Muribaculaceae bacterium]|nr:hypothetical protein [Muribaculaceae bacterium]